MPKRLVWKIHLSRMLDQLFDTDGMGVWVRPIQQLAKIMDEIATRASELNDPKMNALMCRLGLYAISNPDDPEYDPEATRKIIEYESPPEYTHAIAHLGEKISY